MVASRRDRLSADIKSFPEFAGYAYEPGTDNLVIRVTRFEQSERVLAAVRELFGTRVAPGRIANFKMERGNFSYQQLAAWRAMVFDQLFAIAGIVSLDLNEAANRLDIESRDARSVDEAISLFKNVGIPPAAFGVTQTSDTIPEPSPPPADPGDPYSAPGAVDNLRAKHPSGFAEAGRQISYVTTAGTEFWCTLGFNVRDNSTLHHYLTASHCGTRQAAYDGDYFYQPLRTSPPSPYFGLEAIDPAWVSCRVLSKCRWSDALLLRPNAVLVSFSSKVARTVGPVGPGMGAGGLIEISTTHPPFDVVGKDTPVQFDVVDKVGMRSGWTFGTVSATCVDSRVGSQRLLRCQSTAEYESGDGDSGAPVFRWLGARAGNSVVALGIHWGLIIDNQTNEKRRSIFSSFPRIESDLGTLQVY